MNAIRKDFEVPVHLQDYKYTLNLFYDALTKKTRHRDYNHVVDLKKEYSSHISGKGLDEFLKRFVPRENAEMFEQRVKLTQSITPSVCNSLMKPFQKVSRNDNVHVEVDLENNTEIESNVRQMMQTFYSNKNLNVTGIEYWFKSRFYELSFIDPNCFISIEWKKVEENELPEPYPVEIKSENAINYEYDNQTLIWLLAEHKIYYTDSRGIKQEGVKFTYYGKGQTITIKQVDEKYYKDNGINTDNLIYMNNKTFDCSVCETKLDLTPVFRIGFMRDLRTDGRTYINPFECVMPYLRKSLKTVSELDLTMSLHVFPQKFQYIEKCLGENKLKGCYNGKTTDGDICKACNGTGVKVHTTAQDAVLLPFPDSPDELYDLSKLIHYETPPIDLIKFQNEYVDSLEVKCHYAVYNSNIFLEKKTAMKTATEVDMNMEGVYDAIEPYTEKYSILWKAFVSTFAKICGYNGALTGVIHRFPTDLKLKTTSVLMQELKSANDSQAPSFMRDNIINSIAEKIYAGNQFMLLKHNVRHRFYPFNGKSGDEIDLLLGSPYVSDRTKVLYANFDSIFTEIDKQYPAFYKMQIDKQWEVVDGYIDEYIREIKGEPQRLNINFDLTDDRAEETI